jgi:c-di-GMP-binding flagellar brake protein YcgR
MARTAERRICQRLNLGLPVRFSIASAYRDTSHAQKRVFRSLSRNISISGIQIMVQDEALWGLKLGCRLQLEILLPRHSFLINCMGELRNIAKKTEGQDMRYLCVEFIELPRSQQKTLERLFVI